MEEKDKKMIGKYSVISGILILIVGTLDYFNIMYLFLKILILIFLIFL